MRPEIKEISLDPLIKTYHNLLQPDQQEFLEKNHNDMVYGWKSQKNNPTDPGHWNKIIVGHQRQLTDATDLQYTKEFQTSDILPIWFQIQKHTGKRDLLRAYFNGYTYGTEGYLHQDNTLPLINYSDQWQVETVLVYCNADSNWNPDWAGETVFLDNDKKEIIFSSLPHNNRTIVFDSFIHHTARSVSRQCRILRKILVFKTVRYVIQLDMCKNFINERFQGLEHSNNSFIQHLLNTGKILADMKFCDDVIAAGILHSAYGTEYYKPNRTVLRDEIKLIAGNYVEELVYDFCNLKNRTQVIINNTLNWNPMKHYHMAAIEYANLLEQYPRSPNNNIAESIPQLQKIINDEK